MTRSGAVRTLRALLDETRAELAALRELHEVDRADAERWRAARADVRAHIAEITGPMREAGRTDAAEFLERYVETWTNTPTATPEETP